MFTWFTKELPAICHIYKYTCWMMLAAGGGYSQSLAMYNFNQIELQELNGT